ncbi:MAG: VCBS repeat-containing protein, partial [Bacteroidota bacterium]|nr:VCBS repeat-containing protein [Bacteroidota bacterium]
MNFSRCITVSLFAFIFFSCKKNNTLFQKIAANQSGIDFTNTIIENDSINSVDIENVYNGGGVGVGDFNNDGLPDLYFTGNLVSNKLYLNAGNFKFKDITKEAGVSGNGRWSRGVAVIDINNDGWLDIYVCATLLKDPEKRRNLLYINQGLDKNGIPYFKEMAKEYGLDDTAHSTQAAFFDYDNDGDLDVYIVNNEINKDKFPDGFHTILKNGENPSTGQLFRNDWNDSLHHPVFTDVSKQAGIQTEGYGHSVAIADFNNDGWKDIYVTNDFVTNDLLWINNHDGTFTEQLSHYFKHTSANAMGCDVADINNDGLPDVVTLDMNPEDNYRKKMMMNANNYQRYQNSDKYGYNYQYVRNVLQLNQGPRVTNNDSIGDPIFSDVAYYAGMAETDWSWTPLLADFDNDGKRDIIITNGFPKDVTDHDFIAYRTEAYFLASKKELLAQIPIVKLHNYAFRNEGDVKFSNVTNSWGLQMPTFSNGAVYVDLDNDGDLDLVINNINDKALVYKNTAREKDSLHTHFFDIIFHGDQNNRNGIGASATIYYENGQQQVWENTPYRGYLSSVQTKAHFGLGDIKKIDSLKIVWPNHHQQIISNLKTNQSINVQQSNATTPINYTKPIIATNALFKNITDSLKIKYVHQEHDFIDFNIQKLLPHKLSEYGPAMAVGDIDGNGLDDIVIGGAYKYSETILLQQLNGTFIQKSLLKTTDANNKLSEDMGLLLLDADGDGDLDLYISSGGYENEPNTNAYQDRLYLNDGKGNFSLDSLALPQNFTSKSCVRAFDYNHDGKLDLLVTGRVYPWQYPKPVSSFILRNDSKNGQVKFTDVTATVAPDLNKIGMIADAVITDFNNDGQPDIILAGEWMPITFLQNTNGIFKNVTNNTGVQNNLGWWNSIVPGDFNNDGKVDYIVSNLGLNTYYKATHQYPMHITAGDFDKNGSYDAFTSLYLPDSTGKMLEYPALTRDDAIKQMIVMRMRFKTYKSFATATIDQILTPEERKNALRLTANFMQSVLLKNDGNGHFTVVPLPMQAQISMLNGMVVDDFDGDGNLDVIMNTNDYGTEVGTGRYDALNGLLLRGDGTGNFKAATLLQSGIFIQGNGKALVKLQGINKRYLIAASQNRGALQLYALNKPVQNIPLYKEEVYAIINYKNGKRQKVECNYGASFLSQSGRFITIGPLVK